MELVIAEDLVFQSKVGFDLLHITEKIKANIMRIKQQFSVNLCKYNLKEL